VATRPYDEIPIASDVPTVAKILDCDPQTVRNLINRGQLRSVRVGRLVRVSREGLTDFLAGNVTPQDAA
jgi:excisionase family DNA binding protein